MAYFSDRPFWIYVEINGDLCLVFIRTGFGILLVLLRLFLLDLQSGCVVGYHSASAVKKCILINHKGACCNVA